MARVCKGGQVSDVNDDLRALLNVRHLVALDLDDAGRVLAASDERGSMQLVELLPDGATRDLTDLPSRCVGRYVPGSRTVVVMHDNGGDEKFQLSVLSADRTSPATAADLEPLVHDERYHHVLHDVTATSIAYATNRRNGTDMDVVVRDLETGSEQVVMEDAGYVSDIAISHDLTSCAVSALTLQPTGTQILVSGGRALDNGDVTSADEHANHERPQWTSDDGALILASDHEREFHAIFRVSLDGKEWRELVVDDEHDLDAVVSHDGTRMAIMRREDGLDSLAVHDIDGSLHCPVDIGSTTVSYVRWSPDDSTLLVSVTGPTDPGSILTVDTATGDVTTLLDGRTLLPEHLRETLCAPEAVRIPAPDGERIPCFVYRPVERGTGASVINIHGGPESSATQLFSPVIQALVLAGYAVLQPNVRGSADYGKRWVSLDDARKRLDSVADLAALHAWLPDAGLDPDRSALWGGSYGGYMVLAGLTMQPDLWAAGVDIVGMSSLVTFLENTSDYRRAYREREYGTLADDREFLTQASPLTHLDQLKAPLFIIHGANDPRVPLSEAEQIAASLREREIPCELRVYADEGHGLAKRANRLDAFPAAFDFLASTMRPA